MKKIVIILIFYFLKTVSFGQTKTIIDSINKLPFEYKIANAATIAPVFFKNLQNAKKLNYQLGMAESYSNLSLIFYYQGQYDKDIYYTLQAITIFEKNNFQEELATQYGEFGYRIKKRDLKKAQNYMQKGLRIAEKNNFEKPLLSIYNNYGVLKELQNQLDSAAYFYKKGLNLKIKVNDSIGIPYSLNNIAGIYLLKKRYDKALELYSQGLKIRQKLNDKIGITENFAYFGDLFYTQKNYKKAIDYYNKTNENAIKFDYKDLIQYSYKRLSESYELSSNKDLALFYYKKYVEYNQLILNKETNSKIAELEIQYDTSKKEKRIIQQQAESKQKNTILLALSILTILVALVGFLIYRQQRLTNKQQEQENDLNKAILKIENQNKLQEQRLSISRDLHDNIGSQLTFIISSVENVKYGFDIQNEKLESKLSNISSFAKDTIVELRDTIWAMNSNEITFQDLEIRINNFIEKAKEAQESISYSFAIQEQLMGKKLSSVEGMNVYRTIQEAINNSIKYANATIISVSVKLQDDKTIIIIKDNGKGFDKETNESGNGLKNMQKRMEEIGGKFNLETSNEGTKIEIALSL